jgi:hypothetical protein
LDVGGIVQFVKMAPVGLVAVLAAGCDNQSAPTAAGDAAAPAVQASVVPAGVQLIRPRLNLSNALDLRTVIPVALFVPMAPRNLGPGTPIMMEIPNEGTFGCSANFVWSSGGKRYLGAAGHCFVPAALSATHGPAADYDASGVVVTACVEGCTGNFDTNTLTGTWVTLGQVAYARQTLAGVDVGNDFGVVEIPQALWNRIRTTLPVWGGPTGVETLELGDLGCHYGNGLAFGEVFLTKARVGLGGGSDAASWHGDFAAGPGDSGSGMVGCVADGLGFRGTGAIGILTHLGVALDETTLEHGFVLGTTIARAIEMGQEAGLTLTLVL